MEEEQKGEGSTGKGARGVGRRGKGEKGRETRIRTHSLAASSVQCQATSSNMTVADPFPESHPWDVVTSTRLPTAQGCHTSQLCYTGDQTQGRLGDRPHHLKHSMLKGTFRVQT